KEKLEELLALDPNDSFVRYGLAMEAVGSGEDAEAVTGFRELLRRDPNYVPAYLQAGRTLIRMGEDEQAGEMLRQGIEAAKRAGRGGGGALGAGACGRGGGGGGFCSRAPRGGGGAPRAGRGPPPARRGARRKNNPPRRLTPGDRGRPRRGRW